MTDFIIGDLHVPYQDHAAVKIVTRMAHHFKPQNIIINGDALDCESLSHFTKVPQEPAAFKTQLEEMCEIIKDLQRYSKVVCIEGNHEARLLRHVLDNSPELYGLVDMGKLINDNLDTKIDYIRTVPKESMTEWRDDLLIGHFNTVRKYCGYTVKALIERFQKNIVQGHTHRLGEYRIRAYNTTLRGWEGGCLCSLDPEYVIKPNWSLGFVVFTEIGEKWNIETVPITDSEAIYRGKLYKP